MYKKILTVAAMILLLAACAPASGGAYGVGNTLSVTGQSEVALVPDIAYVSIGVRTEANDVSTAVSQNARQVDSVMEALQAAGVSMADLQTTNFSVYSYDDYDFEGNRSGTIFNVENTVYVTVRNLAQMGDLLDSAVSAGANNIWGINFDVDDKSAALDQARSLALQDATQQAESLADEAGVTLGDIYSLSYSSGGYTPYPAYGLGGGGGYAVDSTTIVPGQVSVSVSVYLSYEIQ